VKEIFARGNTIQGELLEERPLPAAKEQDRIPNLGQADPNYTRFTTERPVFAQDNLLERLAGNGTVVRAQPLVQQRGALTNLLISFGPILLLVAFYVWMFRRQRSEMGMGL